MEIQHDPFCFDPLTISRLILGICQKNQEWKRVLSVWEELSDGNGISSLKKVIPIR